MPSSMWVIRCFYNDYKYVSDHGSVHWSILHIQQCSSDLSFLAKMKRFIGRNIADNNLKGSFKTVVYLGAVVKVSCMGKKYLNQEFNHYLWYHSGKRLSSNKHYSIGKYGSLTINGVSVEDSGSFMCYTRSKGKVYKFKHYLTVVQFPSKSLHVHFVYTEELCSLEAKEFAKRFIESKVQGRVCSREECLLSYVHGDCQFEEFGNANIRVTVPVMIPGVPTGICNADCLREKMERVKEEVKRDVISAVLHVSRLKVREEAKEMPISYLQTEDENICYPGFEMKGTVSRSLCISCSPGHFLEKGYCIPCRLNDYSGKYAAAECRSCFGNRVTRSRGSISEEDCILSDPAVFWILLVIFIIIVPFILICCCWSFNKCFGQTILGKCLAAICLFITCNGKFCSKFGTSESAEDEEQNRLESDDMQEDSDISLEHPKDSSDWSTLISESNFVLPSVRHSSGRGIFFKPARPKPITKIPVPPPPPPAMPTDSTLKRAVRHIGRHADAQGDASDHRNTNKYGRKPIQTNPAPKKNMADISSCRNDVLTRFDDNSSKTAPMLKAIMKSR